MVKAASTKNNQKVHTHTHTHTDSERNERRQQQFDALQTKLITPFLMKGTTTARCSHVPLPFFLSFSHLPLHNHLLLYGFGRIQRLHLYIYTPLARSHGQQQRSNNNDCDMVWAIAAATGSRYWYWCGQENSASTVRSRWRRKNHLKGSLI